MLESDLCKSLLSRVCRHQKIIRSTILGVLTFANITWRKDSFPNAYFQSRVLSSPSRAKNGFGGSVVNFTPVITMDKAYFTLFSVWRRLQMLKTKFCIRRRMLLVLLRAWEKKILSSHKDSNLRPSDFTLWCSTTEPQRRWARSTTKFNWHASCMHTAGSEENVKKGFRRSLNREKNNSFLCQQ